MGLRANLVLAFAVLLAAVQMFASATGGPRIDAANAAVGTSNGQISQSVAAKNDNDDEDNSDSDNDEDDDNDDSDNDDDADNDEDNDDSDNDDADNDEDNDDSDNDDDDDADNDDDEDDEDLDNVAVEEDTTDAATSSGATGAAPADGGFSFSTPATPTPDTSWSQQPPGLPGALPSPSPSPVPMMEATGVTSGADLWVALPGDRVGLQVSASTPPGITLTVRLVDPLAYPAAPGIRAGDLIFLVDAVDADGYTLTALPAEARLSARYTDMDIFGLDEAGMTLSRLDAVGSVWNSVPNVVIDPVANYLETYIVDTGVYVVSVP